MRTTIIIFRKETEPKTYIKNVKNYEGLKVSSNLKIYISTIHEEKKYTKF